ncbi:GXWXG domain-containing protein [Rhizobium sp.]|uniref:GXWXG domain-containing protein n=1 Tax=Rhizobium sp. TaxID=391 RepID=UPI0028ABF452
MENTPLQSTLQTEVSNWFNSLEPVNPEDMIGLWKGSGHPSGHPFEPPKREGTTLRLFLEGARLMCRLGSRFRALDDDLRI